MRRILRLFTLALVLLSPLVAGSGCVTYFTQRELGRALRLSSPHYVTGAWIAEDAGGEDVLLVLHGPREALAGPAAPRTRIRVAGRRSTVVLSYRLDRFTKEGDAIRVDAVEPASGFRLPEGARELPLHDSAPGADGLYWGCTVRLRSSDIAIDPRRPSTHPDVVVTRALVVPLTVAADVALSPLYVVFGGAALVYFAVR